MLLRKNSQFVIPEPEVPAEGMGFHNPLDPNRDNADPRVVWCAETGYYYGISTGNTTLTLFRARSMAELFRAGESKVIYEANAADDTYGYLWAPELHYVDGHWYIYTSTHQTAENKGFKHVIVLAAKRTTRLTASSSADTSITTYTPLTRRFTAGRDSGTSASPSSRTVSRSWQSRR